MAGVSADRRTALLECFYLGMDGEHLLDESAAEMEQPHVERTFILGTEAGSGFREELADVGLEPDALGGLPATGGAGFDKDPVSDLTGASESLDILEPIVAAESADGLAFLAMISLVDFSSAARGGKM